MEPTSPCGRNYAFHFDGSRISAKTSPSIRKRAGGTIYIIEHIENQELFYIGKTIAPLSWRIYSHVYHANHKKTFAGKRRLYRAMRKSPTKYRYRVLKKNVDLCEVSRVEKAYIDTYKPSLNMVSGGGGGGSYHTPEKDRSPPKYQVFDTPPKKYPVAMEKGRVTVVLTPTVKSKSNVIYVFQNKKGMRYVGRTGQEVSRRVSQHKWTINSKKSDQQHRPFVIDIKENPKDFTFGILAESSCSSNLDMLEKDCIRRKKSVQNGYNSNGGGGGGHVISRRLVF